MVDSIAPIQIKTTRTFLNRQVFGTRYTEKSKRRFYEDVEWKHVVGGGLVTASAIDIAHTWMFKEEASWWRKYVLPLASGVVGLGIAAGPRIPENMFEIDLLSNGMSKVLEKLQMGLSSSNNFSKLLSNDFRDKVTASFGNMLTGICPLIKELLPAQMDCQSGQNEEIQQAAIRLIENFRDLPPDDFTLESIIKLLKGSEANIPGILSQYSDSVEGAFNGICGDSSVQKNLLEIVSNLNKEILEPNGLICDLKYDEKRNMFDIVLYPAQSFLHPSVQGYHKPCLVIPVHPINLINGSVYLVSLLNNINRLDRKQHESFNKKILANLIQILIASSGIDNIEVGRCEVNKDGKLLSDPCTIGPAVAFSGTFTQAGGAYDFYKKIVLSSGRTITGLRGQAPSRPRVRLYTSGEEIPVQKTGLTLEDILGDIKLTINKTDSEPLTRLKVCLLKVVLWRYMNTHKMEDHQKFTLYSALEEALSSELGTEALKDELKEKLRGPSYKLENGKLPRDLVERKDFPELLLKVSDDRTVLERLAQLLHDEDRQKVKTQTTQPV